MTMTTTRSVPRWALLGLTLFSAAACTEYTIETTLHPDGSGTRAVLLETEEASDLDEYGITSDEFQELLGLRDPAWLHHTTGGEESPGHVFERTRTLSGLAAWSTLNDEIQIAGAQNRRASQSIGYVTLGDVRFGNRVLVGRSARSDGTASYTYQETFLWADGVDALVELIGSVMEDRISRSFPNLPASDRGEVLGQARGRLWEAVEDGVLDTTGGEEDELWARALSKTAAQAVRVVRKTYPEATVESLMEPLNVFDDVGEEELIEAFVDTLPGLNLAINSSISFRLTMPGRVVSTNAHEQNGDTLVWEFSPADAFTAPVVIQAESVSGG